MYQWTFAPTGSLADELLVVVAASVGRCSSWSHGITFLIGDGSGATTSSTSPGGLASSRRRGRRGARRRRPASVGSCCWRWSRCGGCGWPGTWSSRSAGKGEDPRYRDLLHGDFSAGQRDAQDLPACRRPRRWFVSLPLQLSAASGRLRESAGRCRVSAWRCGSSGLTFEAVGDHQLAPVQGRSRQQGRDHGPRPVGVDPTPQLLRRRLRVVGAVAGHHRRLDFAGDGAVAQW